MKPTFILSVMTVALFLRTGAKCDDDISKFLQTKPIIPEKIYEQVTSLANLQYVPLNALGGSPIELALKVVLSALEVFTIASGSHLFTPKAESKREMEISAIASANLCQNLTSMGAMYEAIYNATLFTLGELLVEPTYADKAPERFFEVMEQFMQNNPKLKDIYAQERANVAQKPLPAVATGAIDFRNVVPVQAFLSMLSVYNFYPRIRYFAVNTLFAFWTCENFAPSIKQEHRLLAKSLVTLSTRSEDPDQVEKLYSRAIEKTAEELDPARMNLNTILYISDLLSTNIQLVFAEDAKIGRELQIGRELLAAFAKNVPQGDGVAPTYNSPNYH